MGGWSQHPGNIFAETFAYDPAGNILRATRRNDQGAMMDDLTYFYDPARRHNRLRGVHDVVTGNLLSDTQSGIFPGSYTALY